MKSGIIKRSIIVAGHKTSVSLEDPFWLGLKELAQADPMLLTELVSEIGKHRQYGNLSSAVRLFVLDRVRGRISARDGHVVAHGMNGGSAQAGA